MPSRNRIIEQILRRHVAPFMQSEGFIRKGMTFRKTTESGDTVVVNLQTSTGATSDMARFFINLAVVPLPWLMWMRETTDRAALLEPAEYEGAVRDRVRSSWNLEGSKDEFFCESGDADDCGSAVVTALGERLPEYMDISDREELLRRLREGTTLPGTYSKRSLLAVMAWAAGDKVFVQRYLDEVAISNPDSSFGAWLRERVTAER